MTVNIHTLLVVFNPQEAGEIVNIQVTEFDTVRNAQLPARDIPEDNIPSSLSGVAAQGKIDALTAQVAKLEADVNAAKAETVAAIQSTSADVDREFERRLCEMFDISTYPQFVEMRSADVAEASALVQKMAAGQASADDQQRLGQLGQGKAQYDAIVAKAEAIKAMSPLPSDVTASDLWA